MCGRIGAIQTSLRHHCPSGTRLEEHRESPPLLIGGDGSYWNTILTKLFITRFLPTVPVVWVNPCLSLWQGKLRHLFLDDMELFICFRESVTEGDTRIISPDNQLKCPLCLVLEGKGVLIAVIPRQQLFSGFQRISLIDNPLLHFRLGNFLAINDSVHHKS